MTPFSPLLSGSVWDVSDGTHVDSMMKMPRFEGGEYSQKENGILLSTGFLKNEKDNALLCAIEESRKRWNFSSQYIGL
ncbi:Nuclear Pore Complex Protein Nup93 [Manis pentadactyla]|nr:Nuclear Pore Complex Protein Nup93 [Manis pentadactyla]